MYMGSTHTPSAKYRSTNALESNPPVHRTIFLCFISESGGWNPKSDSIHPLMPNQLRTFLSPLLTPFLGRAFSTIPEARFPRGEPAKMLLSASTRLGPPM